MTKSLTALAVLAATSAFALSLPASAASDAAAGIHAKPMFVTLPKHGTIHPGVHYAAAQSLQTWSGTIGYSGSNYNFSMVGTNPATTNTSTSVTVYVIPVKMVYSTATFDPEKDTQNGVSIVQNILNSPLFNNASWSWGSTNIGTTQYVDAFQRGSFWQNVTTNTSYHVVLGTPIVLTEQSIKPGRFQGGKVIANPFGGSGKVGLMSINAFDNYLQTYMAKFSQINPGVLVLFVTDNVYLTQNGCCIGGYHSADTNGQTYAYATYAFSNGALVFSNDISAFSHELGEWYDDPMTTSNSPCGMLETGDPLENLANYGTFPVSYNGVTWHPQALASMEYFGEPANFSANNWLDNQHLLSSVCQNGS
jgi:hypothetical protein